MSVQVMVNGIPGNMGRIVAETCVARGLELVPYSLTGEIIVENESEVAGKTIQLLKPSNREERIGEVLAKYPNVICIDYTHPSAVNDNAA
ncbi:MAG: dihydrodipicolinate reductase, partial [Fibrobacter sp.]|nr:dihydrodipicolinate reductase [Fibrobacter sp.]